MNAAHALTVTSPRTGTAVFAIVETADVFARTFRMRLQVSKVGKTVAVAVAFIGADDSVALEGAPWRDAILGNGHLDSVDLGVNETAEVLAAAKYMWSKMRKDALTRRADGLARKAAECIGEGDLRKAAKLQAALAA